MFFLGMVIGFSLSIFVGSDEKTKSRYRDHTEAFEDGVSYGMSLNKPNGAIIATNNDEIMVEYADGMMKRFREVKDAD